MAENHRRVPPRAVGQTVGSLGFGAALRRHLTTVCFGASDTLIVGLLAAPLNGAPLVYSLDPRDPWNVIHGLLLTEPEGHERARPLIGWPGDDAPDFFFERDPRPPRSGPRLRQLIDALKREVRSPHIKRRTIEARLLLQQDLWRAFDETFKNGGGVAVELRDPLGRLLSRLAPTSTELAQLRPNWVEIATSFPGLEVGMLEGANGWRELRAVFRHPDATSQHAHTAGHRRVFRAFAWLPPGVRLDDLGPPDRSALLPHGSKVVLVETLVAMLSTGELRPVPLVVGVEMRQTPSPGGSSQAVRLVLHASRLALSRTERVHGGLQVIPDHAIVNSSLGCYPFEGTLEPLSVACFRCHGDGRRLQTGAVGDPDSVLGLAMLDTSNTREQDAVVRRKVATREYAALIRFFRAAEAEARSRAE